MIRVAAESTDEAPAPPLRPSEGNTGGGDLPLRPCEPALHLRDPEPPAQEDPDDGPHQECDDGCDHGGRGLLGGKGWNVGRKISREISGPAAAPERSVGPEVVEDRDQGVKTGTKNFPEICVRL